MPAQNQNISPLDRRFVNQVAALERRLANLERTRQQPLGDWYEFNISQFTFNSTNSNTGNTLIDVDNILPVEDFFQIGDKLWIEQTTDKYFYVLAVDGGTNRITINGGDDFDFTAASFTIFAVGNIGSPAGHPIMLNYSTTSRVFKFEFPALTYTDVTTDFEGGSGFRQVQFTMTGPLISFYFDLGTSSMDASIQTLIVTSPFFSRVPGLSMFF